MKCRLNFWTVPPPLPLFGFLMIRFWIRTCFPEALSIKVLTVFQLCCLVASFPMSYLRESIWWRGFILSRGIVLRRTEGVCNNDVYVEIDVLKT